MFWAWPSNIIPEKKGHNPPTKQVPITPTIPVKQKPQSPDAMNQFIDCFYDGENLSFSFAVPEGMCNLTVSEPDRGAISFYRFDSNEEAQIYVGEIWNASIMIDTSFGNSYEGYIE